MCFKKPKAPPKTAEELALEEEQRQARENAKAEQAAALKKEKDARTQSSAARLGGMFGMRSLISGSKGGSGFFGRSLIGN